MVSSHDSDIGRTYQKIRSSILPCGPGGKNQKNSFTAHVSLHHDVADKTRSDLSGLIGLTAYWYQTSPAGTDVERDLRNGRAVDEEL